MMGQAVTAWLAGNPWLWGVMALALVASHGGAYWAGHERADDKAAVTRLETELRHARAAIDRLNQQIEADQRALENANRRAASSAVRVSELERTADALEAEFAARTALCPVSDDDARRLRDIR